MHSLVATNGKGLICVIASAVLFGCMPLGARIVYAGGCSATTLVLLRTLLALPWLFWLMRRFDPPTPRLSPRDVVRLVLLGGTGMAVTPALLYSAYHYIPSGTATTIHFVYPVFVLLGCVLFLHDQLTLVKGLCVLLCSGGILLFYTPGAAGGLTGLALAFLSGITFALYIIFLDHAGLPRMGPFTLSFYTTAAAAGLMLIGTPVSGQLALPRTLLSWIAVSIFALIFSVAASVLFQVGIHLVGAQSAAILSTFEPITSVAVGVLVFSEPFTLKTAGGVLLILAAVLLLTTASRTSPPSS
ncbi:MAG: DMT family transporter, partial [Oscillospiraceae bacterium]